MEISFIDPGNHLMLNLIRFHDFLLYIDYEILTIVICFFTFILRNYVIGSYNQYDVKRVSLRHYFLKNIQLTHAPKLEFIWTVVPSLILINMSIPTFIILYWLDVLNDPQFTVKVIGNQWYWSYEINNFPWNTETIAFDSFIMDQSELSEGESRLLEVDNFLVLPVDTEFRILVTARDVLHSFALPALAVKMDAVPGRLNQIALTVDLPGLYFGQCSELCGPNHGFMPITLMFR